MHFNLQRIFFLRAANPYALQPHAEEPSLEKHSESRNDNDWSVLHDPEHSWDLCFDFWWVFYITDGLYKAATLTNRNIRSIPTHLSPLIDRSQLNNTSLCLCS